MVLFWVGLAVVCLGAVLVPARVWLVHHRVLTLYLPGVCRLVQQPPLFIVPREQPGELSEEVRFPAIDGLTLQGCYYRTPAKERKGVVLFGVEFTCDCFSVRGYCDGLLAAGYDVFAFDPRGTGRSERPKDYEPMYWVTEYEVSDMLSALAYLRGRPDADPRGVGFFGVSKGAGTGVICAAQDPTVLCCVADGLFGTETAMVPHMRTWFRIFNKTFPQVLIPDWYYRWVGRITAGMVEKERNCRFASLERVIRKVSPRPLLMIHGKDDAYIKPETPETLIKMAAEPKELWFVPGAKHNESCAVAGKEYHERVTAFFDRHLWQEGAGPLGLKPRETAAGEPVMVGG